MKNVHKIMAIAAMMSLPLAASAGDEELCLDCHEPAEDWEGMTADEILASASDLSIKRHADNADFNEEQLRAIIATLISE